MLAWSWETSLPAGPGEICPGVGEGAAESGFTTILGGVELCAVWGERFFAVLGRSVFSLLLSAVSSVDWVSAWGSGFGSAGWIWLGSGGGVPWDGGCDVWVCCASWSVGAWSLGVGDAVGAGACACGGGATGFFWHPEKRTRANRPAKIDELARSGFMIGLRNARQVRVPAHLRSCFLRVGSAGKKLFPRRRRK